MSSGAQPAQFFFPTGTDVFSTKLDYGTVISGESHVIPSSSPYAFYLSYVPLSGTVSIPGYNEAFSAPGANQFQITYTGVNAGYSLFNGVNSSQSVSVSYTAAGDIVKAFFFNNLQQSIDTIENYIVSGLGITGTFLKLTGGTVVGNISMNGANIVPTSSGSSSLGVSGTPFANVVANNVVAGAVSDATSTASLKLSPGLASITSNNSITETATNGITLTGGNSSLVLTNSGVSINAPSSQLTILATGTNVAGAVVPSITSTYNLGSPTQRWGTVYATSINATSSNSQFVAITGGNMTGNLELLGSAVLEANNITNADTPNLSLSAPGAISASAVNVNIAGASSIAVTAPNISVGPLGLTSSQVTVGATVQPSTAAAYDLGSVTTPFRTIYAGNVVGANFSGNFVSKSGDTMFGNLVMNNGGSGTQPTIFVQNLSSLSGVGIMSMNMGQLSVNAQNNIAFFLGSSGIQAFEITPSNIYFSQSTIPSTGHTFDLGGPSNYIRNIYADNINATSVSSGTNIYQPNLVSPVLTGTMVIASGAAIGSSGNPLATLYVSNIVNNGSTGVYVSKAGDSMYGNLSMSGTANILTLNSGTTNIGSSSNPFGTIYANNVISTGTNNQYVQKSGDTMTGALTVPQLQYTGTLNISGTVAVNTYAGQILEQAQQITLSTVGGGAIIANAQTQLQLQNNGNMQAAITASGVDLYSNMFPNTSGTYTLGTATNPFHAIYADNIIPTSVSGTGLYVQKIGDTMAGTLNFSSGVGIALLTSGTSNIGSAASPLNGIYASNYYGPGGASLLGSYVATSGGTMNGNLNFAGANITSTGSFTISNALTSDIAINSVNNLFLTASLGGIFFSGNSFTASPAGPVYIGGGSGSVEILGGTGGVFVSGSSGPVNITATSQPMTITAQAGFLLDTSATTSDAVIKVSSNPSTYLDIDGNTRFSGNVIPFSSGTYAIGTASLPFSGIYAKTINGNQATVKVYNEIPAGLVNGSNTQFYTVNTPVSGTTQLYRAGLRQTPNGVDYTVSGSGITFVVAPLSGNNILIDYERSIF